MKKNINNKLESNKIKKIFLFLLLSLSVFVSCDNNITDDPCYDIDCANHGECAIDNDNNALCICTSPYKNDTNDNKICVLPTKTCDLTCNNDEECKFINDVKTCVLITKDCNLNCEDKKVCNIINNNPTCIDIPESCEPYKTIFISDLKDTAMLKELHKLIMPKIPQSEVDRCNANSKECGCVNFPHDCDDIDYQEAKEYMFGYIDNKNNKVLGVYTGEHYNNTEGTMPNQNILNCEHTWPQSQFGRKGPMKSDLHHLYPTFSTVNSSRGHLPFSIVKNPKDIYGDCDIDSENYYCSKRDKEFFEPANQHKGNVARSMLYFAVRYGNLGSKEYPKFLDFGNQKELFLKWHKSDPVDQNDIDRNEAIFLLQHDRNPFIDCPSLLDRVNKNTKYPVVY